MKNPVVEITMKVLCRLDEAGEVEADMACWFESNAIPLCRTRATKRGVAKACPKWAMETLYPEVC